MPTGVTVAKTLYPRGSHETPSGAPQEPDSLASKLCSASKEELVSLIERLATDSEEHAARIRYLTDPETAVKALHTRISAIRKGKRFASYGEVREVANEIAMIALDLRADVLPVDAWSGTDLANKLFCLDEVIFERADGSSGLIGAELRAACILWLDAAAAARAIDGTSATDWPEILYELYTGNDYGIREPLLEEAQRLLREDELRSLASRFERETCAMLEDVKKGDSEFHRVFSPATAMGLIARALRDPTLYERSVRIYSPYPNELQAMEIARHYLEFGNAADALRWLLNPGREDVECERLDLLDRAYDLLGHFEPPGITCRHMPCPSPRA